MCKDVKKVRQQVLIIETKIKIFRASNIMYLVLTVAIQRHCDSTETVWVKLLQSVAVRSLLTIHGNVA